MIPASYFPPLGAPATAFDPVALGLPSDFVLTDYTRLKGCSCKLAQPKLIALLRELTTATELTTRKGASDALPPFMEEESSRAPGSTIIDATRRPPDPSSSSAISMMDCSIIPLRRHRNQLGESLLMVSTTDFFFPSVEDPFLQGQIGAANVLSDLYAMGIVECDNMLMLLAASTDMDELERSITTREILRGFAERVRLAKTCVTGGQTVMNPWPLIGGVAMSVVTEAEMIRPTGLQAGDVLVLTKPLGNQLAVNLKQWVRRPSPAYEKKIKPHMSVEEIDTLYNQACASMKRLNRTAARLMHVYHAHGATDITGFGILGHAGNLGEAQTAAGAGGSSSSSCPSERQPLCLELHTLPIFKGAVKASRLLMDQPYRLLEGFSAETSGGLLIAFENKEVAQAFIHAIREEEKEESGEVDAWIVGNVIPKLNKDGPYARLDDHVKIVEI